MIRQVKEREFDRKNWKPVIYGSISGKEQAAGFKELKTGRFMEIMTIHNGRGMDRFLEAYDISVIEIVN